MTSTTDKFSFTYLLIAKGEKNIMEKVVSSIYENNIQIRKEKDLSVFHKVDPLLLWFFNMVDYCKCLVLICFADDSAFGGYVPDISCYDNYLYRSYNSANMEDDSGVSDWELYNIIMRHFLDYLETNK